MAPLILHSRLPLPHPRVPPRPQDRFRGNLSSKDLEVLEKAYRDVEDPRRVNHVRLFHDAHPKHYGRQAFDSAEAEQVWHLAEELRQKIRCVSVCVCVCVFVCVFARKRVVSSVAHPRWLPSAL